MRAIRLLLLLPLVCHGAESVKIDCRLLGLEGSAVPPPLVIVATGGAEVRCTVPASTLSASVACAAVDGKITFLSDADRKPAATARIPAGTESAILVFIDAGKAADQPWQVFVIDDEPANFPDGGAFVANLHVQEVRFTIGETKAKLASAGSRGVARPDQRDDFNMAPVVFEFQREDKWITASESMLRFAPGMRYLILASVDPVTSRPRVSTYQASVRAAVGD